MSKGFDVLHVNSAVKSRNRMDLSRSHLTTAEFGQIIPLFCEETVPGDKFAIRADYFSRLAPLVKPTYGKFEFRTVFGFVPYHQIAVDAESWLAGKTTFEGITPHHRYFLLSDLHDFVVNSCTTADGATSSNSQYDYVDASGAVVNLVFTPLGKYYVKVLNALGYALPHNVDFRASSVWSTSDKDYHLSAYPFLAFCKLYNDYMSQSQRFNTSLMSRILFCIKNNIDSSLFWDASSGHVFSSAILSLLSSVVLSYDNGYFTSAWQTPSSALAMIESVNSVPFSLSSQSKSFVNQNSQGAFYDIPMSGSSPRLYNRALDFLRRFDDWVRRNNYSGSRSVQQIYSRFGIKTDDYRTHYAHVYATTSVPIQVGDVTATSDSVNVPLGDYAGKGIMSDGKSMSAELSDYGMLFVLGYFTVDPMMPYGYNRHVLRNSPLDYYNPEFDGLGAEPISMGEVYSSPIGSDSFSDFSVFGFTERYNSYRFGRDNITGDFRNYRNGADMNTWHAGRLLSAVRSSGSMVAQSVAMNTMSQVSSEYNRIFAYTGDDFDHFYLTCSFDVSAVRPMLNLNQVVDLGEGDTTVPRNGNVIS